ncbi:MAG: XdhC family protein [Clostridia bacterium]|nr:XdhC family protein [Clostridia bacterium]
MFQMIVENLSRGEDLVLVTVTASSGATPRGAGARMLVGKQGRICGTIGGGAVEYRSEQIALQVLEKKTSGEQYFSLTREDVQNLGMICGGDVNVFFHYIPEGDADTLSLVQEAQRLFEKGEALWLISDIASGGTLSLFTKKNGIYGHDVPDWVLTQLPRQPKLLKNGSESYCVEQINGSGRVYIFGCGHVSQELEPVLTHVGFRCTVMDDRPEFAKRELFPTAEEVKLVDFSNIAESITIHEEDYVCVLTRGHAFDTVIQAQVLKCKPAYVGVIGSRKKAAGVRQILKEQYGLTEEELNIVTTPIGVDIDAETPAEIAISIAGQMIQTRARRNHM